jgi:hypothetical protein
MASAIRFTCPDCTYQIRVPGELAGKRGLCPECRVAVRVPSRRPRTSREVPRARLVGSQAVAVAVPAPMANPAPAADFFAQMEQAARAENNSTGNLLIFVGLIKMGLAAMLLLGGEPWGLVFALTGTLALARGMDAKGWL